MTKYVGRILILSEDSESAEALEPSFQSQGFATLIDNYAVILDKVIEEENPDLILMCTDGDGVPACDMVDILKNDPATSQIPIAVLASDPTPALHRRCFSLGVDDLVVGPMPDELLFARVKPLVRLSTMYSELRYRVATAREFGVEVEDRLDLSREERNYRVLVAGGEGEDLEIIRNALEEGYDLTLADDFSKAQKSLDASQYDALVLAVSGNSSDALKLCSQIRNNSRLFNLPVLLIADAGAFADEMVPYNSGASNILSRPLQHDELQIGILTLVCRQKMRWDIRNLLLATLQDRARDEDSELYSHEFFNSHLVRRTGESLRWEKHLALVAFQIENIAGIKEEFGVETATAVYRQACYWVSAMLRAEDVAGSISESEIVAILPDTTPNEAGGVAQRVSDALNHIEFTTKPDDKQSAKPLNVWMQMGAASLREIDSAESLFRRARENFKASS